MKHLKRAPLFVLGLHLLFVLLSGCQEKTAITYYDKGTFGFDLAFLQSKDSVIVLSYGNAQVIVSPKYQGKVFTSTANGLVGTSFGWINHEAIAADTIKPHINVYGGEDRLWLGPEGGQFSIFFKDNAPMELANWQTPPFIDTEAWDLVSNDERQVTMRKPFHVVNNSKHIFDGRINRQVTLRTVEDLQHDLGITLSDHMKWVGYKSDNVLTNTGTSAWTQESGTLCLWVMGMFNASDSANILIPYIQGDEAVLGRAATTDYFGEIPSDRITVENGLITFKADCNFRSKIGVSPQRATSFLGSYDAINKALTIVKSTKPSVDKPYINQQWKVQEHPFVGDVINAYNDGPVEDGSQLGAFYELETSSPAAFLAPQESISHSSSTYHLVGTPEELAAIALKLFGADLLSL